MRRCTDPLALDPLSPIGISPIAHVRSTTDPLAIVGGSDRPMQQASGVTPVGRTGHATGDPPGRDAPRASAALPT